MSLHPFALYYFRTTTSKEYKNNVTRESARCYERSRKAFGDLARVKSLGNPDILYQVEVKPAVGHSSLFPLCNLPLDPLVLWVKIRHCNILLVKLIVLTLHTVKY